MPTAFPYRYCVLQAADKAAAEKAAAKATKEAEKKAAADKVTNDCEVRLILTGVILCVVASHMQASQPACPPAC